MIIGCLSFSTGHCIPPLLEEMQAFFLSNSIKC